MPLDVELCPLCFSSSEVFYTDKKEREYRHCICCDGVFLSPQFHLQYKEEHDRYNTHNNIVTDIHYQSFVNDICNLIRSNEKKNTLGLDFGCGPGPVIQHVLLREGYHLLTYDPYYQPDKSVLKKSYDYIVSCEVVEHFNKPQPSFLLLKQLLKPKGKLYIKTDILYEVNRAYFEKWGYRNDPTHVFFYTPKTFEYIKKVFHFTELQLKKRTVILSC